MQPEQVISVVRSKAKDPTNPDQVTLENVPCIRGAGVALKRHGDATGIPSGCISSVRLSEPDYVLTVYFVEDYPAHPGHMSAFVIRFNPLRLLTQADIASFSAAVYKKYGLPTSRFDSALPPYDSWCKLSGASRDCTEPQFSLVGYSPTSFPDPRYLPTIFPQNRNVGPIFYYQKSDVESGSEIDLEDCRFAYQRVKSMQKYIASVSSSRATQF